MPVMIRVPGSLKDWFDGRDEAICGGNTIQACFDQLREKYICFYDRIFDEKGEINNVLIFLNGENIRNLDGLATKVNDEDEIGIIPLAAGG